MVMTRSAGAIALAIALIGCQASPQKASEKTATAAVDPLAATRAAIANHNFGDALTLARQAAQATPVDPKAQYELARAEALSGNQGNALDALTAAINAGLADPAAALADPAFDALRGTERFVALTEKAQPSSLTSRATLKAKAGDGVEIGSDGVRAGDVTIGGKF